MNRYIWESIRPRQLFHARESKIAAVHADTDERLAEEILLGLADGMVTTVIDNKNLDRHPVADNCLKLL